VTLDIGAGDGRFAYRLARENPHRFFLGIDANAAPLCKISEKIHRRPERGGAANLRFVLAAVEELPPELDHIADQVQVQFPWGSLLRGVVKGDELVLGNLRRVCLPEAQLEVVVSLEETKDRSEIERLNLPALSNEYLGGELKERYRAAGFALVEHGAITGAPRRIESSWGRRLQNNPRRRVLYLRARAIEG